MNQIKASREISVLRPATRCVCSQCWVVSVRQDPSLKVDGTLREKCARKYVLVKSNKSNRAQSTSPLLLAALASDSTATVDGISSFRMAFAFFQTRQLPSLYVWHNLQPKCSHALFYNDKSRRNFEGSHHRRRFMSMHAMFCRAVSVESQGDKDSSVFLAM